MIRLLLVSLLLVGGTAGSGTAQVKLQWKIRDGQKTTATEKTTTSQTLTLAGMDIDTKVVQNMVIKTTAGKRAEDGTITVNGHVESIKVDVLLPGGVELNFDSAKAADPPGTQFDMLLDVFKAVAGAKWTNTHGKDNRVIKITGWEKAVESLDEELRPLLKSQTDPDYLKEVENKQMDIVPSMSIKKGDTWKQELTARLDSGQRMTFKTTYEYAGTIEQDGRTLHKITYKSTDVDYFVDKQANAPFDVKKSDLKVDSSSGHFLFDQQRGEIVEQSEKTRVKGELTLEIGGQELPGKLDLTFEKSTTVK